MGTPRICLLLVLAVFCQTGRSEVSTARFFRNSQGRSQGSGNTLEVEIGGEMRAFNMKEEKVDFAGIPLEKLGDANTIEIDASSDRSSEPMSIYTDDDTGSSIMMEGDKMEGVFSHNGKMYSMKSTGSSNARSNGARNVVLKELKTNVADHVQGKEELPSSPLGRSARMAPKAIYVDVCVVVDYALYQKFRNEPGSGSTDDKIRRYFAFVFNGVARIYANMNKSHDIHVRLVNLVVLTSYSASTITEGNKLGGNMVNGDRALDDIKAWLKDTKKEYLKYDHVMVFTSYNLAEANRNDVMLGLAGLSRVCYKNGAASSIVEDQDQDFQVIITSAHELAHSLGSTHDGSEDNCDPNNHYVMAPSVSANPSSKNPWIFSSCSETKIANYIAQISERDDCLKYGIEETSSVLSSVSASSMPGLFKSRDEQCKAMHGNDWVDATTVRGIRVPAHTCLTTQCGKVSGRSVSFKFMAPYPGTPCGSNKWCIDGDCVPKGSISSSTGSFQKDPEAEAFDPDCVDNWNVKWGGKYCWEVTEDYCRQSSIAKDCCKTCKKLTGGSSTPTTSGGSCTDNPRLTITIGNDNLRCFQLNDKQYCDYYQQIKQGCCLTCKRLAERAR